MSKKQTEFDELITELQDISNLSQKGYDFRLQTFLINDTKDLDEWNQSIDGILNIIKNNTASNSMRIICIRGQ